MYVFITLGIYVPPLTHVAWWVGPELPSSLSGSAGCFLVPLMSPDLWHPRQLLLCLYSPGMVLSQLLLYRSSNHRK